MKKRSLRAAYPIAAIIVFAAALAWLILSLSGAAKQSRERQRQAVADSVENGITLCYSIEGEYPESLERLTESYGVVYDEDRFIVHYGYVGANIRPNVTVIGKGST